MNSQHRTPRRLSVSTWSLHRALGSPPIIGIDPDEAPMQPQNGIPLLETPALVAQFGIGTMELCHFHLPSRETEYLEKLRQAMDDAKVELWSLLIDSGDISHPQHGERDTNHSREWLDVAQTLGAKRARVAAGHSPFSSESFRRTSARFRVLADGAQQKGLRLMTENWYEMLSTPQAVHELLGSLNGDVGLCLDFGNWESESKYDDLRAIAPLAESCHAKARFSDDEKMDEDDFARCLEITREAGFSGPYTLINGSPGDEWRGLQSESEVARKYL